jgi:transcriptional regulator with XRE-family HTH domain
VIIISGRQIRAARALLNWSQRELSRKAKVAFGTVQRMERFDGPVGSRTETLGKVVGVLEKAGIEFLNTEHPGLRLRTASHHGKGKTP